MLNLNLVLFLIVHTHRNNRWNDELVSKRELLKIIRDFYHATDI